VAACATSTQLLAAEEKRAASKRFSVLLIVSEDNGPHLGCYGDTNVETPHLDRLATDGVRFERAFVATASCSESRSSILTGLYPHQNGQIGLATHRYSMYPGVANIPSLLKREGYRTGILGKLHVNPESAFPFDFRWNEQAFCSFAHRDVGKIAEVAGRFIAASEEPFFLMVNYPDAHLPWLAQENGLPETPLTADDVRPPPFLGIDTPRLRQDAADYYNCISRLDTGVGMLLDRLSDAGADADTLVIYVADHGAQFVRGKLTCYEPGLRVPLIVRWPGVAKEGSVRRELIATVDLLPTILEAAGAEVPAGLAGRSLLPLVRGERTTWRQYLCAEYHSHYPPLYFPQRTVRDDRYKLIVNLLEDRPCPAARSYRSPDVWWTNLTDADVASADAGVRRAYATWDDAPPEELYDLEADPHEFHNLANSAEHAAVRKRLRRELEAWQAETGDPLADPAKLEQLTREQDAVATDYNKKKPFTWKYHDYLRGDSGVRER
jgi:N-sulfoglucosamine sulfohydrolase